MARKPRSNKASKRRKTLGLSARLISSDGTACGRIAQANISLLEHTYMHTKLTREINKMFGGAKNIFKEALRRFIGDLWARGIKIKFIFFLFGWDKKMRKVVTYRMVKSDVVLSKQELEAKYPGVDIIAWEPVLCGSHLVRQHIQLRLAIISCSEHRKEMWKIIDGTRGYNRRKP